MNIQDFAAQELDWSFLKTVTVWQVGIVIIAIWIIIKFLIGFWPGLKNTIKFIDTMGSLESTLTTLKKNDVRVEDGVKGLHEKVGTLDEKLDEHIDFSIQWKARLDVIDERTQPTRKRNGENEHG